MKDFFKKFKSYGFWVTLSSVVIVLLNALGRAFGFSIENQIIEDIILGFASVLMVLGIVGMASEKDEDTPESSESENEENIDEEEKKNDDDNMNK